MGMVYGHSQEGDMDQKNIMMGKVAEFKERYAKKRSSTMCRDLLGHESFKRGRTRKGSGRRLDVQLLPGSSGRCP